MVSKLPATAVLPVQLNLSGCAPQAVHRAGAGDASWHMERCSSQRRQQHLVGINNLAWAAAPRPEAAQVGQRARCLHIKAVAAARCAVSPWWRLLLLPHGLARPPKQAAQLPTTPGSLQGAA